MVTSQPQQLKQEFINYLKSTFGEEFPQLIHEPKGVQIGERVLYKLKNDKPAVRHELSKQEIEALHQKMVEIAKSTGADESAVTTDPPTSSGLPYPRLVDLPGAGIIWDKELKTYLESDELLPAPDFSLEWAIGIVQASDTLLMYLDFTHPKVKAIFTASYDFDWESIEGRANIRDRFKQFHEKERELKAQIENNTGMMWAKIVQLDSEPLGIKIKNTSFGILSYNQKVWKIIKRWRNLSG